jgi:hypothetical protein
MITKLKTRAFAATILLLSSPIVALSHGWKCRHAAHDTRPAGMDIGQRKPTDLRHQGLSASKPGNGISSSNASACMTFAQCWRTMRASILIGRWPSPMLRLRSFETG